MSAAYVAVARKTPMLLPRNLGKRAPSDDIVHFVIEAVEGLSTTHVAMKRRETGSPEYPPQTLLALLICCANGVFPSRRIETAAYRDVAVRHPTANAHPDHPTICAFRRANVEAIHRAFLHFLKLAQKTRILKVGAISVDGAQMAIPERPYLSVCSVSGRAFACAGGDPERAAASPCTSDVKRRRRTA